VIKQSSTADQVTVNVKLTMNWRFTASSHFIATQKTVSFLLVRLEGANFTLVRQTRGHIFLWATL